MFKDLPEGETHSFHLALCEVCHTMTNHYDDGKCARCEAKKECNHIWKKCNEWISECEFCGLCKSVG